MVDIPDNLFEFFYNNGLLDNRFDLFNSLIFISDLNYFFILSNDFFNSFNDDWYFNNLFDNVLNVSVHIDDLWDYSFDFNYLWNFNHFFMNSFNFINFRYCDCSLNNLFDNLLSCNDLLNNTLDWDNFLNNSLYFFYFFSYIWNLFHNFFVLNRINYLLFNSRNLSNFNNLFFD